MKYTPRENSRTSRNQAKQRAKNRLGSMRDGAPSTYRTLLAVGDMVELVHLASNGKLRLQLVDENTDKVIDIRDALADADRNDFA